MGPHRLIDERRETSRTIAEQLSDSVRVRVSIHEDTTDIEKHGARTALSVHAFRSFWYCEGPTTDPLEVV